MDPLAARKRDTKQNFNLKQAIEGAVSVFEKEASEKNILINTYCDDKIYLLGWKQDMYTIMANLLDNSIFWIEEKKCSERNISIKVSADEENIVIDYTDSGPGISNTLLESGVIFEPEFTTKIDGTGLGLAIAGEAASRNGLSLKAIQADKGAHFTLQKEK